MSASPINDAPTPDTATPARLDPIIKPADVRASFQVTQETVRAWIKAKKLPPYDVVLSRKTKGWKRSTLIAAGMTL